MKFLADENLQGRLLHGLLAALPDLDIVRVQDTDWSGLDDPSLLEQAARIGAILITHDVQTITRYAFERVRADKPMPGVIEVSDQAPPGIVLEDLVLLIAAGQQGDFENQVRFVPLPD